MRQKIRILEEENRLLMSCLKSKVEEHVTKLFEPIQKASNELLKEYSDDAFYFTDTEISSFQKRKRSQPDDSLLSQTFEENNSEKPKSQPEELDPNDYYVQDWRTLPRNETPDTEQFIEWQEIDGETVIKCATLDKLIERVTYHAEYDNSYLSAFMLTYRSFITPHELMDKLIARYNIAPPNKDITKKDFAQWYHTVLNRVRARITQVLKHWLEKHFYDFDEELLKKLIEFSDGIMMKTNGEAYAASIKKTLEKVRKTQASNQKIFIGNCPKPQMPTKGGDLSILEWPPTEVARQITLIEYEMFKGIEPKECLNQNWNKTHQKEKAPHIYMMIQWFNKMGSWVATQIVTESDAKQRVKVLAWMIKTAYKCKALNNFNAVFEIVGGLTNSSVHRLTKTFEALDKKEKQMYEELKSYVSREGNYKALRSAIRLVSPPCIPYIGMYLTDLTFIEDGNPDLLNGKLNFIKRRKLFTLIRDMQTLQQTPYELKPVEQLQKMILDIELGTLPDSDLYQESLLRQPRERK